MSAPENPTAFPFVLPDEIGGYSFADRGMTLRDWFAGQALAGMYAGGRYYAGPVMAKHSFETADAMLAARGDAS